MDAVLVAMSCFALLCQEAEIRCGSDEVTVTYLVPNYHVYQELAQASTVLTTGKHHSLSKIHFIPSLPRSQRGVSNVLPRAHQR